MSEQEIKQQETEQLMLMQKVQEDCWIDMTKELELPPVAISYGEHEVSYVKDNKRVKKTVPTPIGTYGNFSYIQAPPKAMKTYFVSLLSSVYLSNSGSNNYGGSIKAHDNQKELIHFDTEQGDWHSQNVFRRAIDMNQDADIMRYHTFALRKESFKIRIEFIEHYIKHLSEQNSPVGLVIIDGVADLVSDVNNLEESTLCVQKIMEISARYNCHIITIIHTNYGSNKATGHLGSYLAKKCETSIQLEVNKHDKGCTTVQCNLSRSVPFNSFNVRLTEWGYPKFEEFDFDLLEGVDYKQTEIL